MMREKSDKINMKKDTLLIVDDTPDNVRILRTFLMDAGFKMLIAGDGEEGIQITEYAKPDLILLDIMMPKLNGFEVCRHLKSQKSTQEIPIIFMTALTEVVDKIQGFNLGAADYITKPFNQYEVLARVKTHLTLQNHKRQLEKRNLELDAFAHTVAHDLKNPLASIVNLSDLFLERHPVNSPLDFNGIKKIRFIEKAALQAINTVTALLTLSGVSRQPNITIQRLEMSEILKQVIQQSLALMITESQAQIDLPKTWVPAVGYAPWVAEIWTNYLSNGIKYGGQPPHLTLGSDRQSDNMIRFWIRDNGKGLSPENMAKLFTPFMRLHQKRVDGHGLGLSIIRQIVEKLDGQVGVESEIGQGSLFYFTLPAHTSLQNK